MKFQRAEYDVKGNALAPQLVSMLKARPVSDKAPIDKGYWHAFAITPARGQEEATFSSFLNWLDAIGARFYKSEVAMGAPATRIFYYLVEDPSEAAAAKARNTSKAVVR